MFTFANFTLPDLIEVLTTLRKAGLGADSMEETANRMARYVHESFLDRESGSRSCALVRFFVTRPYGMLDAELKTIARTMFGEMPDSPAHKCLSCSVPPGINRNGMSGSAQKSSGFSPPQRTHRLQHQDYLAADHAARDRRKVRASSDPVRAVGGRTENVQYLSRTEAEGSPYIPQQQGFVLSFHIKSVLGFGGLLPSGELFTLSSPCSEEDAFLSGSPDIPEPPGKPVLALHEGRR
ncbi:MAG: hypothetical protein H0V35_04325 [Nitrospira sp.]|nr:hypothetical protein [Nitrospira sp.]